MSYYQRHRRYDDDPYLLVDGGDYSYVYPHYDDRSGGGRRNRSRHPSRQRRKASSPFRKPRPHSTMKRVNHRPKKMNPGKRMIKPLTFKPSRQKNTFSASTGGASPSHRRREPRYDEYKYADIYDDYTYEGRIYKDPQPCYAYEYDCRDDVSLLEQRNYPTKSNTGGSIRPAREARPKACGGIPSRLFFCADDANRDDVTETTDDVFNGQGLSCSCFDKEFSFRCGGEEDEEVDPRTPMIEGQMVQDYRFLLEEAPTAERGFGRDEPMKYAPRNERDHDRLGRHRMNDDATYTSEVQNIDPSIDMSLLDDLAAASKWSNGTSVSLSLTI